MAEKLDGIHPSQSICATQPQLNIHPVEHMQNDISLGHAHCLLATSIVFHTILIIFKCNLSYYMETLLQLFRYLQILEPILSVNLQKQVYTICGSHTLMLPGYMQ